MNKTNIFLMTFALTMSSAFSQAADRIIQVKDIGVDGEHRLYDVICASGEGTTLFHYIGDCELEEVEMPAEDSDIINIESLNVGGCIGGGDAGIESDGKLKVCNALNQGGLDCGEYEDIDTAAEAVCKKLK